MRTSVVVTSLALLALALLAPVSGRVAVGLGVPVESYEASQKNAASSSDYKTASGDKTDEAASYGGVEYRRGSENTATSQDKDTAQASQKKVSIKGVDGSSYDAQTTSVKKTSLDVDTKTSKKYYSVKA